jgi:LacI family transcriptional regulator
MPLTLEDIARLSGVSRSTVSRVINADVNVKEDTRRKVLEIIQDINFQPNLAAKGLATGRTNVIGIVIPASVSTLFTDPYFPQFIQGVATACNNRNFLVMLWLAEPEYERRMISRILHNGLVDGVIVASTLMNDPIVTSLYESKMPFILIGRHPTLDVNYLDVDNLQAGWKATMHLLRLGYKRIATITGPQDQSSGYDRYQGYLKALQDYGQPIRPELAMEGDFTEEGSYKAMQRLIPHKPDAIFAASDMMAYGAMRALREANLRIPEDVGVVGFDDMPTSAKTNPPLTTVRQQVSQMGSKAVEVLIALIGKEIPSTQRVIMDTELVVRESCGASQRN